MPIAGQKNTTRLVLFDKLRRWRMRMLLWALHSSVNLYYHIFQSTLCLLACILYVAETYRPDDGLFEDVETFFGLCFLLDYMIQCATACYGGVGMMIRFMLSNRGIVDFLSIVPVLSVFGYTYFEVG
jgi:hypothetical protein